MAKSKTSDEIGLIESAWGVLGGFVHLLVKLARELQLPAGMLYRLGTPEGEATLIAATKAFLAVVANIFTVKIGGPRAIAEVVAGSGYTHYDRSILERCRLAVGPEWSATIEIFSIEHFDHDPTDEEIEAEYVRRGLKRPDVDHAIHFGDQVRNLPVEGHPVIFYLKNPISYADGSRGVLGLWRRGAHRRLYWYWLDPVCRWNRSYLFAGVRE